MTGKDRQTCWPISIISRQHLSQHVLPNNYQSIGRPPANTSTMYQKYKAGQILEITWLTIWTVNSSSKQLQ